jgi:apolipoprotein N-acyltransferase
MSTESIAADRKESHAVVVHNELPFVPLNRREQLKWAALAVGCFHLAYEYALCAPLIIGFLHALFRLAHVSQRRDAMILGWIIGLLIYGPQLAFFWTIFGAGAISLWLVLGTWLALYLVLQRFVLLRSNAHWARLAAPLLWTGLEYFRSELYYLRFSWLNIGYVFSAFPDWALLRHVGMYGIGFLLMLLATNLPGPREPRRVLLCTFAVAMSLIVTLSRNNPSSSQQFKVAGVQLEFQADDDIRKALDALHREHPDAQLIVLSEYTFDGPVPSWLKEWCAKHRRYLVVGAKDYLDAKETQFRNTAFVIGPEGQFVFQQAKAVPIQFFSDGRPASEQRVWNSPWGRLGICVCYDLSYTRVTDELIRQGAQGIIVPTMDVQEWGERQHRLHGRVAPVRAAEYGVPIFRLCSSGISQAVRADGHVLGTAPFPGQGEMLDATMLLADAGGKLPLDRWLVWPSALFAIFIAFWHLFISFRRMISSIARRKSESHDMCRIQSSGINADGLP